MFDRRRAVDLTVVAGGTVIDGKGQCGRADVIVRGPKIDSIVWGGLQQLPENADVLPAQEHLVIPGLIDMHAHDEVAATVPCLYEGKIRQGVTTVLIGMDGFSFAPLDWSVRDELIRYWKPVNGDPGMLTAERYDEYARVLGHQLGVNVVFGVPHANLRIAESGFALRSLTTDELDRMVTRVRDGMEWGCYGLSTGLSYTPAVASDTRELLRLAEPVRGFDGLYVSHLRSYGANAFEAVEEALRLARELSVGVHLSHLRLSDPAVHGRAEQLRTLLESARRQGLRVTWDLYPYSAGSTALHAFLPAWIQADGPGALLDRLEAPATRTRLLREWVAASAPWDQVIISFTASGRHVGQSLSELSQATHTTPAAAAVGLLTSERLQVGCVVHQSLEADDIVLAEGSGATVGSDGIPFGQRPHPRYFGAFAASYRRYVRDRHTWSPQDAIWRMSTLPARLARLRGRGIIEPGAVADLVVVNPDQFCDQATYSAPRTPATGVSHVLIGGQPVLRDGIFNARVRYGQVLHCGQ